MTNLTLNRRKFLLSAATAQCALTLAMPLVVRAAEAKLQALPLTERITLISGAGGNIVCYRGDTGITLIDSGTQAQSGALLNLLARLHEQQPVTTVFNTHWHEDHTGGNEALHASGATILAHENTRLWLGAEFEVPWRQEHYSPRPPAAMPDTTFYTSGNFNLGSETVQYHHVPQAHTDGDIFLYFPVSNVMVAGGLMTDRRYPLTDIASGGWIGGLLKANEAMLALANAKTLIIPDRGPAKTRAELQAQYDMLASVYEKMKELAQQGFSGHDMLNEKFTAEFDPAWGDPEEFILETYRGMWAHTYDMGGFI